jgi:2Fe-2S ferredoxin
LRFAQTAKVPHGEQDMVECTLRTQENSRLSCQISVTPQLDGLVVRLPKAQI